MLFTASQLKRLLRRSPLTYRLNCFIKEAAGTNKYSLATKNSDICIEGYPSSANSFLYYYIAHASNSLAIAHHTHAIANIKMALTNRVPTYVTVRKPIDAIASNLSRFKTNTKEAIEDYIDFYDYCLANASRLSVLSFDQIIANPTAVVNAIFENAGIAQRLHRNYTEDVLTIMKNLEPDKEKLSLSNDIREAKKIALKSKIGSFTEFARADLLYKRLMKDQLSVSSDL